MQALFEMMYANTACYAICKKMYPMLFANNVCNEVCKRCMQAIYAIVYAMIDVCNQCMQ